MLNKMERIAALKFKYPDGGYSINAEGKPVKWKRTELCPTDNDLSLILESKEYLVFKENLKRKNDAVISKINLNEIDLKSIRALREWLVNQPDAPEFIKEYEAQAIAERNKLK